MAKKTAHKKAAKKKPAAKRSQAEAKKKRPAPSRESTRGAMKSAKPTIRRKKSTAKQSESDLDRQVAERNAAESVQFSPAETVLVVCSRDPRHTDIDSQIIKAEFEKGTGRCGCGAPLVTRTQTTVKE